MANKRPKLSFAELEPKGRGAILRSAEEVRAEEALLTTPEPIAVAARPRRARSARAPAGASPAADTSREQSLHPSINRPVGQSVSRLANRPVDRIVDRPKAFYITERLDQRLDDAVRYFQLQHGLRKVDRSTLVNVLLGDDALWTDAALEQLIDRLISQLTSRLTS